MEVLSRRSGAARDLASRARIIGVRRLVAARGVGVTRTTRARNIIGSHSSSWGHQGLAVSVRFLVTRVGNSHTRTVRVLRW